MFITFLSVFFVIMFQSGPMCSHAQALKYFVDTIFLPTAYPARKCKGSPVSVLSGRCARSSNEDPNEVIFVGESCAPPAKK